MSTVSRAPYPNQPAPSRPPSGGKTCTWCAGHGFDLRDEDWEPVPCPQCAGVGTVPGLDPEIVRQGFALARYGVDALLRAGLAAVVALALGCPWTAVGALAVLGGLTAR